MTSTRNDSTDRRELRRAAQARFDELVAEYSSRPGVSRGSMFGSEGLKHAGSFLAFVGGDGELIVKLPADRVRELIDSDAGAPVQPSGRPMREWVALPRAASVEDLRFAIDEAFEFALRRAGTTG